MTPDECDVKVEQVKKLLEELKADAPYLAPPDLAAIEVG